TSSWAIATGASASQATRTLARWFSLVSASPRRSRALPPSATTTLIAARPPRRAVGGGSRTSVVGARPVGTTRPPAGYVILATSWLRRPRQGVPTRRPPTGQASRRECPMASDHASGRTIDETVPDTEAADDSTTGGPGGEVTVRRWRFPSAFTVLFVVTVAVWVLSFVVPSGEYVLDPETGQPLPGTYEQIDLDLSFNDRLYDLFMAPVNGLYRVEPSETGVIGPYESGELFGAAGVFLFVLAIGVFITMTMRSGAIDAGIARVGHRFGGRGLPLIIMLMFLFSLGGTAEGMAE